MNPLLIQLGNANISRLASRVGSRARAELLTMLQLILPGTNSIYYGNGFDLPVDLPTMPVSGEEIGMRNLPDDTQVRYRISFPLKTPDSGAPEQRFHAMG